MPYAIPYHIPYHVIYHTISYAIHAICYTIPFVQVAGDRFDSFVGIVGGVCAVPLALVYPPLFHLSLFSKTDSSKQERNLHRGLLVVGVFAGLSSTIVAIKDLL